MFNCIKGGNRASNSRRRFTEFEPDDTRSNTRSDPFLFSTEPEHGGKCVQIMYVLRIVEKCNLM